MKRIKMSLLIAFASLFLLAHSAFGIILFEDDFSTDKGWIYGTEWQRGAATSSSGHDSGYGDPANDHSATADDMIAGTVIGGNVSIALHSFYYLTSPIINCSSVSSVTLSFWRWLNSDYTPYMESVVEVYNGSSWTVIFTSGDSGIEDSSWTYWQADVSAYAAYNANFRVRFGHTVTDSGVFVMSGWNIDDFVVSTEGGGGGGGADAYESDDTPGTAKWITVDGGAQARGFHDNGDLDYIKFNATAGETYTIYTYNLGDSDTILTLYDTDGTTYIDSDDDGGIESLASLIEWTCPSSGTYYIRVEEFYSDYGSTYTYNIEVTTGTGGGGGDSYENDDTFSQANPIVPNGPAQSHNFANSGDFVDFVSFNAKAGVTYEIYTFDLGPDCDTYLFLAYINGLTNIAASNNNSGLGLDSKITWQCKKSGLYYIVVINNSFINTPDTYYKLKVKSLKTESTGFMTLSIFGVFPTLFKPKEVEITSIYFGGEVLKNGIVVISDIFGNIIKTWESDDTSGKKFLEWDGKNDNNDDVEPGLYIISIEADEVNKKLRVVLVR